MKSMGIEIYHKAENQLGEAPYWSRENETLYWVDIVHSSLFSKAVDGQFTQYDLPEALTSFFVLDSKAYGCTETGYCEFDLKTNNFRRLIEIEKDVSSNRSNDGKFDGDRGFIFGTMSWSGDKKTGSIYHVDIINLECTVLDTGFFIPNGFTFNSEFSEIVIADSYLGKIYKYQYDVSKQAVTNKQEIVDMSASGFSPDGMVTTADNKFWNAVWDGACLHQYDFYGQLQDRISLPVLRPTSCVFGGLKRDQLYITTAREGLSEEQIIEYPYSGSILKVNMDQRLTSC